MMGMRVGIAEASERTPSMSRELMLAAAPHRVNIDDQYQSDLGCAALSFKKSIIDDARTANGRHSC
jgi:hypothetical protein